ncbi:threonine synthase [Aureococcus anophagefferens]|uniref:Threonine synthase n=1 Tax=Aureococcus anophagefferens TaxID=44056 RepID=A0ABR1G0G2_AURAN
MGLAPDKGLLVPHSIPEAYSTFRTDEVTPVAPLGGDYKLLELFHGPTYAFKGVALQFLGFLFELILQKGYANGRLTIIGATSGDTGSSAIEGIRGKKGVDCFILYPNNRTSKIQEAQMCSVPDENCHAIALEDAFFDDCQKIVKTLFADQAFHKKHSLGAVNSINWARIVAQIAYYFYAQLKFDEPCHFSVPTGNFGDVLAGWYAKQMGCPCKSLVVATNANDILARFFATGTHTPPPSVVETVTPSMDISVSSNFERFVYHCCGDDDKILKGLMDTFEATGAFTASPEHWEKCKAEMYAGSCQQPQILATIKKWHEKTDYFPTSIEKAIGAATLAEVPEEKNLTDLLDLPKRKNVLVNSLDAVVDFVEAKVGGGKPAAKKAKK